MAQETLNSAKMILGDQIDYPVVSMAPDDGLEGTITKLDTILEKMDNDKSIVIIVDLMGGTPANVATLKASMDSRISVITGMNLGMVLESFLGLSNSELADHLKEVGIYGVQIPKLQVGGEE